MSANPDAIVKLWTEFKRLSPDADDLVLGGIYAAKSGYHNTRANHLAGRNGGSPSDYSIQAAADKRGPSDKAAALDITFNSARASRFGTIAKYSKRLYDAFKNRDPRLFYNGKAVVREFFGNTDLDRTVEGWSLYRNRAASSDSSHLWHIHISFHREFADNYEAIKGVLDVLLARPTQAPKPPVQNGADEVTAADVWNYKLLDSHGNNLEARRWLLGISGRVDEANQSLDDLHEKVDLLAARVNEILARLPENA